MKKIKITEKEIITNPDIKVKQKLTRKSLIPRMKVESNYSPAAIKKRQIWLEDYQGKKYDFIFANNNVNMEQFKKNIENPIGHCSIPLSIVGPFDIKGEYAKGEFYVPFATTQGTLVDSYQRGSLVISISGGATVKVIKDQIDLDPIFNFDNQSDSFRFYKKILDINEYKELNQIVSQSTAHGKLIKITPYLIGKRVLLRMTYTTGDAMGLNLISIASANICDSFVKTIGNCTYYLRSNLTSDKKSSHFNIQNSYGKEVQAEIVIPANVLKNLLHTSAKNIADFWEACVLGMYQGGVVGHNAHVANGVASIFMATGQDIAQVTNASTAIAVYEANHDGSLYAMLKFPSLPVASIGGGTNLPHQKECLEIMGCLGVNKSRKIAEIICVAALAGEISIMGALTSGEFAQADIKHKLR